ncbi:MAG: hypothetical protein OEV80_06070, partial [candidate division Zixibacteria bacterium]|nr:hypothetical protein [candidate division Zixibacteria bacterium]
SPGEALARFDRSLIRSHQLLESGQLVFSVADDMVAVNEVSLPSRESDRPAEVIEFEHTQSLIEDGLSYFFDAIQVGADSKRCLALKVRQTHLSNMIQPFTQVTGGDTSRVRFTLRAEALGQGFIHYAPTEYGDFACLIDFNERLASLCFVHRREIIGVAHLATSQYDMTSTPGLQKMAAELKTIVNFKLAAFSRQNISVPLSAVFLSGSHLDTQAGEILHGHFSVGIREVVLNSGFFPQPDKMSEIPAGDYVVALGLTVLKKDRAS